MMISQVIRVLRIGSSFLSSAEEDSVSWMYTDLFIHSSVGGRLGCFHFGGITNEASVNIRAQGSLWTNIFLPLR